MTRDLWFVTFRERMNCSPLNLERSLSRYLKMRTRSYILRKVQLLTCRLRFSQSQPSLPYLACTWYFGTINNGVPYSIMVIQSPSNCRKQKLLCAATHTRALWYTQLPRRPELWIYRTIVVDSRPTLKLAWWRSLAKSCREFASKNI